MKRTPKIIATAIVTTVVLAGGGVTYAVTQNGNDDAPLTGADLDKASTAAIAEAGGGTVVDSEKDGTIYEIEVRLDDGTEVDVDLDESFTVIRSETDLPDANDSDDDDDADDNDNDDHDDNAGTDSDHRVLTDAEREQATAAALAETGEGTVTQVEADDDRQGSGYDVEVRLADGTEVDLDLDASFIVTRTETDLPDND